MEIYNKLFDEMVHNMALNHNNASTKTPTPNTSVACYKIYQLLLKKAHLLQQRQTESPIIK